MVATSPPAPSHRGAKLRWILLAGIGAAVGVVATVALCWDWDRFQDWAWFGWIVAAALLGIGLDGLQEKNRSPWTWQEWGLVVGLVGVALCYRFASMYLFPGTSHVTGIEELQAGDWGAGYLQGSRGRWEFVDMIRLSALAQWLWGPSLPAIRVIMSVVSALTTVAVYAWLRADAGRTAATVGSALFACSFWATVYGRLAHGLGSSGGLLTASAFALLAGPVRRGRPSGFVWVGVCAGEILYEYIAYRPLVAFVAAGVWLVPTRATGGRRLGLRLLTVVIIAAMAAPLVATFRRPARSWWEFADGWKRARLQAYYDPHATWPEAIAQRTQRVRDTLELFYRTGDGDLTRNVDARPLVDPVTAGLLLLGIGYGLWHRGVAGLAVGALCAGVTGTLIVTGNWDVGRASAVIVYVYALAGYGAAAFHATVSRRWGRTGHWVATGLLVVGVAIAAAENARAVYAYSTSPIVRRWQFFSLPFFSSWLRVHVRPDEQVVAVVSPDLANVLDRNDAAWLRGAMEGRVFVDPVEAVAAWRALTGPAILTVYVAPHVYRTTASQPFSRQMLEQVWMLAPELREALWEETPAPDDCPGTIFWTRTTGPSRSD